MRLLLYSQRRHTVVLPLDLQRTLLYIDIDAAVSVRLIHHHYTSLSSQHPSLPVGYEVNTELSSTLIGDSRLFRRGLEESETEGHMQ